MRLEMSKEQAEALARGDNVTVVVSLTGISAMEIKGNRWVYDNWRYVNVIAISADKPFSPTKLMFEIRRAE